MEGERAREGGLGRGLRLRRLIRDRREAHCHWGSAAIVRVNGEGDETARVGLTSRPGTLSYGRFELQGLKRGVVFYKLL
jgi:hypothetical protein